ncbi:hypothetical protein LTR62_003424 [Meristemomyces frigidus]|uniref:Protein kinase domain-containing protein n=1 Tax=Meristemomyces frigidus TaxID=1508187 RepID=A0AAN7YPS7_9PEZI|nr:hypothetical protein LTR62_003424 [Meristemomyces frigidus]
MAPMKISARIANPSLHVPLSLGIPRQSLHVSSRTRNSKYIHVDEESLSGYNPQRYCPIKPGSTLAQSYTALVKLGYGRASTTWLCKDIKYVRFYRSLANLHQPTHPSKSRSAYKVLNVGAADATHRERTTFEKIGRAATDSPAEHRGSICVRQAERMFDVASKGQTYNCFVFEPLGPNLLEFTNRPSNRPFGSQNVRVTATYLLHAMDFLHTNGIAHTAIKLDNIQITLPDEQDSYLDAFRAAERSSPSFSKLGQGDISAIASREMEQDELGYPILCDLGSAVFDEERYPGVVQALPYRAPEVILGAAWDHKIDVWNFGVLIWELLFTEQLFGDSDERGLIEAMIRYVGIPPKSFLKLCRQSGTFFDGNGNWTHGTIDTVRLEDRIEQGTSNADFFDFLRCALQWDPRERSSAAQLLDHSWLK